MAAVLFEVLQEVEGAVALDDGSALLQHPAPAFVGLAQLYSSVVVVTVAQAGPYAVQPDLDACIAYLTQEPAYVFVVFPYATLYGYGMDTDELVKARLGILGIQVHDGHVDDFVEHGAVFAFHFFDGMARLDDDLIRCAGLFHQLVNLLKVVVAFVDIDEDFPFAEDEHFLEGGYVVACYGGAVLRAKTELLQLVEGEVGYGPFAIGTAVHGLIVHEYELAVFSALDVYFYHVNPSVYAALEGRNGVLGMVAPVASMSYDCDVFGVVEEVVAQLVGAVFCQQAERHDGQDNQKNALFHRIKM